MGIGTARHLVKYLEQAKNLSVVEIHLADPEHYLGEVPTVLAKLEVWKTGFIEVLMKSPSKGRKFLRWNVTQLTLQPVSDRYVWEVLEAGELEVLSRSSP